MTNVEVTNIALLLGGRADAIEIWLESDPDAPEMRIESARENMIAMRRGSQAISHLLKRLDHLGAYIYQTQREVDYTRHLIQDIINHER